MENPFENEYPAEATVGDQWQRGETGKLKKAVAGTFDDLCWSISQVAYQLYLSRGKTHGHDLDDWLAAERIVLNQLTETFLELGEEVDGEEI